MASDLIGRNAVNSSRTRSRKPARRSSPSVLERYGPWAITAALVLLVARFHDREADLGTPSLEPSKSNAEASPPQDGGSQHTAVAMTERAAGVSPIEAGASQSESMPRISEDPDNAKDWSGESVGIEIKADPLGAYRVRGRINGHDVVLLIDTGASWIAIPDRLRHELSLRRGPYVQVATAGGVVGSYETAIDRLDIGPLRFDKLKGLLNPRAPDDIVLLGMSALRDVRFEQRDGRLTMVQSRGPEDESGPTTRRDRVPEFQRDLHDCLPSGRVIDRNTLDCLEGRGTGK